jgi:hypothetical protein
MGIVKLQRGDFFSVQNPTLEKVKEVLESANDDQGPPDLQLYYGSAEPGQPQLWLWLLFEDESLTEPQWCVRFAKSRAVSSLYLASRQPTKALFLRRTRSGVIELFRAECILKDQALVLQAVDCFLKSGTADPSLVWLDSGESVRDYGV